MEHRSAAEALDGVRAGPMLVIAGGGDNYMGAGRRPTKFSTTNEGLYYERRSLLRAKVSTTSEQDVAKGVPFLAQPVDAPGPAWLTRGVAVLVWLPSLAGSCSLSVTARSSSVESSAT